ncbi:MAG: winged helix-turn-helix transcriptional regulator [Lentisphaerae bacterium]|nr:winged helix-turn-helix transcriptional regulator [Lentisphaerota bacterium]
MANASTRNLADLAEVFKALGHPTRLWIVRSLAGKEMCVCDIVAGTNEDFSAVSQHLNVLKKARVVEADKRGKHVFYKLLYDCIPLLVDCMEMHHKIPHLPTHEQEEAIEKQSQAFIKHLKSLKV